MTRSLSRQAGRMLGLFGGLAMLAGPLAAETPLAVELVAAKSRPVVFDIDLTGTIMALDSRALSFRIGGRVAAVSAELGAEVAEGDALARLEPTQAEAMLRAAQAQGAAAQAGVLQAEQSRDRLQELLERGSATRVELDSAEAALLTAQASLDQARVGISKAEQAVRDLVLRAPIAGTVTTRSVEAGQIVGAAQTVLSIAPTGSREAVFHVPNFPEVDDFLGQDIAVQLIDPPRTALRARVTEVAPVASVSTGTTRVRARILDAAADPGLGALVSGAAVLHGADAVWLPWSALASDHGAAAVWVVDPASMSVALQPVEISHYTTDGIEIAGGLAEGQQVVALGSHLLFPGRVVRPAPEVKP